MPHTVVMPKFGQATEESTIVKWHKAAGDKVEKGEIVFEIETDKAVLEVESFFEGTLLKIVVPEGVNVPVGAVVAFIGAKGEPVPDMPVPQTKPQKARPAAKETAPAQKPIVPGAAAADAPAARPAPAAAHEPVPAPGRKIASPRARFLARECAISVEPIPGAGPNGRVTEKDVRNYLAASGYDSLRVTPAAKNLARAEGIDLVAAARELPAGARLEVADVRRAVAEKPKEMSRMRQVIAQRLAASWTDAPHFFVTVSVDVTGLLKLRKELKKSGKRYSLTDFLVKSVAAAIADFPAFNSFTEDGRFVRWRSSINMGIAVDLPEGLVVPVVRGADRLALGELHEKLAALVLKARQGKLTPDEMSGGTFTISNMGMLDVENFTAIINPGESAILAVSSGIPAPAAVDGDIAIRTIMKMTLSSDHRIIDGATAARFANRIKHLMEDIGAWKNLTSL